MAAPHCRVSENLCGEGPTGLWENRWLLEGVLDPFCPLAAFCAPLDATSYAGAFPGLYMLAGGQELHWNWLDA